MFKSVKNAIKKLPGISRLVSQRDSLILEQEELRLELKEIYQQTNALNAHIEEINSELIEVKRKQGFAPAGHFYSPIPSFDEIKDEEERIFENAANTVSGIDFNGEDQLKLVKRFVDYYENMPFQAEKKEGLRYYFENPAFSYSDAIFLHCMIRDVKPKRIIEVGSGFSSCMMLDTNELFFDESIATTFIEPYPELLMSLIKDKDKSRIKIIPSRLQDVDLNQFDELQANDILFIDSTHVSKIDSDVNRIMFEILPRLSSGVYIHFHDIFFPFEYPKEWVFEGRAWNEAYILKAFLQFNESFRIVLMNTYLNCFHQTFIKENLPLCLKHTGSIWIRKD